MKNSTSLKVVLDVFSLHNKSRNFNVIWTRFLNFELSLWAEITIRYHYQSWLYHGKCGFIGILKAFSYSRFVGL